MQSESSNPTTDNNHHRRTTSVSNDDAKAAARESFVDSCLGMARNEANLVEMELCNRNNGPQQTVRWEISDLLLLGQSLMGNTHLKSLTIHMETSAGCRICLTDDGVDPPPYLQALATLSRGIMESQLQTLQLRGVCCNLQLLLLQGVAWSTTIERLELRDTQVEDLDRVANLLLLNHQTNHHEDSLPINKTTQRSDQQEQQQRHHHRSAPTIPSPHLTNTTNTNSTSISRHLTHLGLRSCKLDDMDMLTIALAFSNNTTLVYLDFETNHITTIGVLYLISHWRDDSALHTLDLTENRVSARGALAILQVAQHHAALRKVILTGNEGIGHVGLEQLGHELARLQHLEYLELHQCTALAVSAIPTRESKAAARAIADGLQANRSLVELHVGGNHFGVDGAMAILQVTRTHPTLEMLALVCDESIGLEGLCQIGRMLPQTRLKGIQLDGIFYPWPNPPTKLSRQAGQALLEGVRNSPHLIHFTYHRMDPTWMEPIQVLIQMNRICRVLFSSEALVPSTWPYILAQFGRHQSANHLYFSLREQPWLTMMVNPTGSKGE